jgi:hypothetical protein
MLTSYSARNDTMATMQRVTSIASILALAAASSQLGAQPPKPTAAPPKDEITALIDVLPNIADGDVGYMPTQTGGGFLPLGVTQPGAMLLFQQPPAKSDSLRELVKRGAAAVPHLIAHLDDKRPTKITIKHEGGFGGMFFDDEYDYNSRTSKRPPVGVNRDALRDNDNNSHPHEHTVTVGDLASSPSARPSTALSMPFAISRHRAS